MAQRLIFESIGEVVGPIQVVEEGTLRYLRFGARGGWQGAYNTKLQSQLVFPYQRAFRALVSSLPSIQTFLSFGVGTGTALRTVKRLHPECKLHGIDIEQTVIESAVTYFNAPSYEDTQYFVGDGIHYLESHKVSFSLVFIDAYLKDKIYSPVMNESFLAILNQKLEPSGTVVFNIIDTFSGRSLHQPFYMALRELFSAVLVQPVGFPATEQNGLVVATNDSKCLDLWRRATRLARDTSWYERFIQPYRIRLLS